VERFDVDDLDEDWPFEIDDKPVTSSSTPA